MPYSDFEYIICTWKRGVGLSLYINALTSAADNTGQKVNPSPKELNPNFNIGRNIHGEGYGEFIIGSFTVFNTIIEPKDIQNVHIFFWSNCKLCLI